jgi:hypothetical protein
MDWRERSRFGRWCWHARHEKRGRK